MRFRTFTPRRARGWIVTARLRARRPRLAATEQSKAARWRGRKFVEQIAV
jgi:hypothetical protein